MLTDDELKRRLQEHFVDGLVTVVGSGLSCAEGLPSMGELAETLISKIPSICSEGDISHWKNLEDLLQAGEALETAINKISLTPTLSKNIIQVTAEAVRKKENIVIFQRLTNKRKLKIEFVLERLSITHPKKVQIVTTNYDRLIEVACEKNGYWVDTGFCGRVSGKFDPQQSIKQGAIGVSQTKKAAKLIYPNLVKLSKPHGSLDWHAGDVGPFYSPLILDGCPLIITPGQHKYREGYELPFDTHIRRSSDAIDKASALLFIGYGFNDDHLQTHLQLQLKKKIPMLILTKDLSPNARKIINTSDKAIALSQNTNEGQTTVTMSNVEWNIPSSSLWDIEHFVKEVLSHD